MMIEKQIKMTMGCAGTMEIFDQVPHSMLSSFTKYFTVDCLNNYERGEKFFFRLKLLFESFSHFAPYKSERRMKERRRLTHSSPPTLKVSSYFRIGGVFPMRVC